MSQLFQYNEPKMLFKLVPHEPKTRANRSADQIEGEMRVKVTRLPGLQHPRPSGYESEDSKPQKTQRTLTHSFLLNQKHRKTGSVEVRRANRLTAAEVREAARRETSEGEKERVKLRRISTRLERLSQPKQRSQQQSGKEKRRLIEQRIEAKRRKKLQEKAKFKYEDYISRDHSHDEFIRRYREDSALDSSLLTHKPSSSSHQQSRISRSPSPPSSESKRPRVSPSRQSSSSRTISRPSQTLEKNKSTLAGLSPSSLVGRGEPSALSYGRGVSPDLEKSNIQGRVEKLPQHFLTPLINTPGAPRSSAYFTLAQVRALEKESAVRIQKWTRGFLVRKYWRKVLHHKEKRVPFDIRLLHNALLRPFDSVIQKVRKEVGELVI